MPKPLDSHLIHTIQHLSGQALTNVKTEWALIALAYNAKRMARLTAT
jgi:hypothetical protein